jgi:ADP-ribose pyrophosphatase
MNQERKTIYQGKHLEFKQVNGWEYVERRKACGIVGIAAITPGRELLMVEQFRPPLGKRIIEIPAGLAGDIEGKEDESLLTAAKRELLEETGYEAADWQYLTRGPSSAGLCTEVISFYKATGLKKVAPGGGDGSEDIEIHQVPVTEIHDWLQSRQKAGALVDYKVYAALYWCGE